MVSTPAGVPRNLTDEEAARWASIRHGADGPEWTFLCPCCGGEGWEEKGDIYSMRIGDTIASRRFVCGCGALWEESYRVTSVWMIREGEGPADE